MNALSLVEQLEREGAEVWEEAGKLRFRAPRGVITEQRRALLRSAREEVIAHLRDRATGGVLTARPDEPYEPFPLTDVQAAYLLGRRTAFAYGGIGCHGYGEVSFAELDPARLQDAWQRVLDQHDMLRAVVGEDGTQRVLPPTLRYDVPVVDARDLGPEGLAGRVEQLRSEMSHRVYQPGEWPMFDLRATLHDGGALLHLSIDFLIADLVSTQLVLDDLYRLYHEPGAELPPIGMSFRDYVLAYAHNTSGRRYKRDRDYWLARIEQLAAAPELPVLEAKADGEVRFARHQLTLAPEAWRGLRRSAGEQGITPSVAVLTAYAEVIGRWSRHLHFTLNLTLQNREPVSPDIHLVVGDFTSVGLLEIRHEDASSLRGRAHAIQSELWDCLDHRSFSGLQVAREIGRRRGQGAALFPVVFTSAIGVGTAGQSGLRLGDLVYGITQTPQVWIDCQALEREDSLLVNWDVRQGVFAQGLVEDMFGAFERLVRRLADDPQIWEEVDVLPLPPAQAERRRRVNATSAPVPETLLHSAVVAHAERTAERVAVVAAGRTLTYGEILERAKSVAEALQKGGCEAGEIVAIVMDKGWEQVVGVLGVLLAGGVYVPVDSFQPQAWRDQILADARVGFVLTQSRTLARRPFPDNVEVIAVDSLPPPTSALMSPRAAPDDLAYVIYTSGSTGQPKGVMISHRSALNTVLDINRRFHVEQDDVVLGLANLGFDLSVYDIFGPLSAGGQIVLPDDDRKSDPSHWATLVADQRITLWNSVPAQMQMLYEFLSTPGSSAVRSQMSSLRLALLSGDWIPVKLPGQIRSVVPGLEVVSLGGATEAAIWSIFYPITDVPAEWSSIPYGLPLSNQSFQVLDAALRPCPELVPGELYIGGTGLARGYFGDDVKTAERFIRHPRTGERLYRTGDIGRYLRDGTIEFLGREDRQVKIRGHRIELAEVEKAVLAHPSVGQTVVLVEGVEPLQRRLIAIVEPSLQPDRPPGDAKLGERAERAALAACEETLGDLDSRRYNDYWEALDRASLSSMLAALTDHGVTTTSSIGEGSLLDRMVPRYHRLVRRWIAMLVDRGLMERCNEGFRATDTSEQVKVDRLWANVEARARGVEDEGVVAYFRRCAAQLGAVLTGLEDPLFLLFPRGQVEVSEAVYRNAVLTRAASRMMASTVRELAAAAGDPLRVLEIGGGTGGATLEVLQAAATLPADYVLTDLSPFFLSEARRRLADYPFVRYAVLDLNMDVRAQGLQPNSFDLVLALDVLHSTQDVNLALGRIRELLVLGGWVVFTEMTRDHPAILMSLELLLVPGGETGDFHDRRRGRNETFLTADGWRAVLADAGVSSIVEVAGNEITRKHGMRLFFGRVKMDRATVDTAAVLRCVRERVPEFMVPAQLQVIDALPLTANGKVDQKTLLAWLAPRAAEPRVEESAPPLTDLERRIVGLWCDVLGLDGFDHTRGFLELGGDSLLAARLAARIRDELPEGSRLFFDELLRLLLEGPTVAELAQSLDSLQSGPAEATPAAPDGYTGTVVGDPASPLQRLAGDAEGPVVVLVHDGSGELERYRVAIERLAEHGRIFGLTVSDGPSYLRMPPETVVERSAEAYASALVNTIHDGVHLVGAELGSMLAMEVARRLNERGVDVLSLTLVDPQPVPGTTAAVTAGRVAGDITGHTARAVAAADVAPYAGDMMLLRASDSPPLPPEAIAFWRDVCLGDVMIAEQGRFLGTAIEQAICGALSSPRPR